MTNSWQSGSATSAEALEACRVQFRRRVVQQQRRMPDPLRVAPSAQASSTPRVASAGHGTAAREPATGLHGRNSARCGPPWVCPVPGHAQVQLQRLGQSVVLAPAAVETLRWIPSSRRRADFVPQGLEGMQQRRRDASSLTGLDSSGSQAARSAPCSQGRVALAQGARVVASSSDETWFHVEHTPVYPAPALLRPSSTRRWIPDRSAAAAGAWPTPPDLSAGRRPPAPPCRASRSQPTPRRAARIVGPAERERRASRRNQAFACVRSGRTGRARGGRSPPARRSCPSRSAPEIRLQRASSASSAVSTQRKSSMPSLAGSSGPPRDSQPHRHHDVPAPNRPRRGSGSCCSSRSARSATVRPVDRRQRIQQVVHVEADLDLLAPVTDLDLFLGLFLLRVVRLDRQQPSASCSRMPRYFSFDRIAVRCSAWRRSSRSARHDRVGLSGITRPYSGKRPSISFDVKRMSPIWART